MEQVEASRRALIAGGTVAVAAAVTGWWWHDGTRADVQRGAAVVTPGSASGPLTPASLQAQALGELIGQTVRIGGEFGSAAATIVEAIVLPTGGVRPADIRALTYQLTFLTDRAGAPKGGAIYPLAVAIDGMEQLFMTRGADRGDRATLIAVVG